MARFPKRTRLSISPAVRAVFSSIITLVCVCSLPNTRARRCAAKSPVNSPRCLNAVSLYKGSLLSKLAGAEFDQGGVQAQQSVLEAEAMRTGSFAAAAQQLIKHGAVQLPGPMLVGIRHGGGLGRIRQPQVPQLALAGGQSAANLAQGLRPPQVTEQHGHELSPATEPASVALGPVLGDRLLELLAGKQLQHLAENAGYSYHGGGGPPYDSRLATQTVAEFYPRRSKPNLDKSEEIPIRTYVQSVTCQVRIVDYHFRY